MLDVLFVVPPLPKRWTGKGGLNDYVSPLGIGYLAAVLEKAGYRVDLVNMQTEQLRQENLAELLRSKKPRIVGITTTVTTYKNGLRAAQLIKDILPETKVLIGGPQATFLVEETLSCSAIDVLARFEGEETILELIRHFDGEQLPLEDIQGIAFMRDGQIHKTERRPLIANLDLLPAPAWHLYKLDQIQYKFPVIVTARGCPSKCVFCAANTLYPDPSYRVRSPQLVVDEIAYLVNTYGIRSFMIGDDAFTLRPKRAMEICDLLIAKNLDITWTCEARVDTMSPELAQKLKDAGCFLVQYGVETGNPEIMKFIRKGISLKQVEKVVDFTQAIGLNVACTFILGFPWDTHETTRQTIEFGRKLERMGAPSNIKSSSRGRVSIGSTPLTPLPGTYVYEHAEELGIRFLTKDWDQFTYTPVIETPHLTAQEIRRYYVEHSRSPERF